MRKPEIGYSAARLLVGRPTITKYFDQRQLGGAYALLLTRNINKGGECNTNKGGDCWSGDQQ
jgi:hypothetical protein